MSFFTKLFLLLVLSFLSVSQCTAQRKTDVAQKQGEILSDVPQKVDALALYLFYLHGKIVEQDRRPTHPQHGVYEYDQILGTFKQNGFVVISEQRKKDTDVEQYGKKVAGQVRQLLEAKVPPEHITVVGASQGSWMAMLASTYLKNRNLNFVLIGACAADDGLLELVDFESSKHDNDRVWVRGETAFVNTLVTIKGRFENHSYERQYRVTYVFEKTKGMWYAVTAHATLILQSSK